MVGRGWKSGVGGWKSGDQERKTDGGKWQIERAEKRGGNTKDER